MPGATIEQRSIEDKVPYDKWAERALLLCPGHRVDYQHGNRLVGVAARQLRHCRVLVGYDSWNSPAWVEDMETRLGIYGKTESAARDSWGQTLSAPMKDLKAELASKHVNYNNNPLMKWALTNMSVEMDKNENIRLSRGKNQRQRIDPAVALHCYTALQNNLEDYKGLIGW